MGADGKKRPAKKGAKRAPPKPARQSRTRETAASLTRRRDRVWHIAILMASGEWRKAKSDRELAGAWGVAVATVQRMAAEASTILDLTTRQRTKLVKLARARLSQIAMQDGTDRVPALRTLIDHLGEMPRRYEHSGPDGAPIPVDATARVVILPNLEKEPSDRGGPAEAG